MGLFYTIYKGNVNRGFIGSIYEGNIYTTWGTNENYIGLRPKVYGSILADFYSKTRNPNSNFNNILLINK